jgi:thioesterase domain-containing protein
MAEAFWRRELEGFVPAAWRPVPNSSSPPSGASRPAEQDEQLSVHTTTALQALARQHHLTLNTFVQGAWAILLSRYFQRDEVLFGVTVAGRPVDLRGAETMIGLFINTLPFRVRFTPQSRLLEWLQHIQDKGIEIQQYDYSPLAKIQAWSDAPRGSPLFDTILVFENYPNHSAMDEGLGGLEISDVHSIEQSAYPLTVAVTPGQQLSLRILYDPACFEPAAVRRLLDHLRQVLERMIADPNQCLLTLSPFTRSERDQAFESWGAKVESYPAGISHTPLFGQQSGWASEQEDVTQDKGPASPGNPLQEHLVQRWEKLLKTARVGIHDNFFELGGDSLIGAICIHQLRDALRETIPLAAIFEAPTVFELARYLERKHPAGVAHLLGTPVLVPAAAKEAVCPASLVPIQPRGNRPPLFCIHPAGGVVFPYYTLAPYLGQDQPLYGVQDLSLYDAQSTPKSVEAMAAGYLEALKTVQRNGPYHLLGWSVGGTVAYEMAQQLSQQGQSIALLALLDTTAPPLAKALRSQLSPKDRLQHRVPWVRALSRRIQGLGSVVLPIASYIRSGLFLMTASAKRNGTQSEKSPPVIDLLGWAGLDTWRARLLQEAEVASTISQDASLLLVEMPAVRRILELVREHRRLARRYIARPYPGRITLFRAVSSEADKEGVDDPTMGWGLFTENGVEVHTIQANHVALLARPYVETLARELQACLEQSRSSPAGSAKALSQQ